MRIKEKQNLQKGFTLIEMIVALGIFTVVAVIAVGSLLKVMDANRKSQSLKTAINNVNFALESISRELRVGRDYYCISGSSVPPVTITAPLDNCPSGTGSSWTLAFNSTKTSGTYPNDCRLIYAYRYSNGTLKKAQQNNCTTQISNSDFQDLISQNISLTASHINVTITDQPRVFVWFKGSTGVTEKERTTFSVQTTVSQRIR